MKPGSAEVTGEMVSAAVSAAGLSTLNEDVADQFAAYYDLLQRWNARLSLTSIRDMPAVLQRHFVECIFCADNLPQGLETLLDYGSGAGFPGIPIALCRPELQVTLAESHGKKVGFLREALRVLGLSTEVFAGRVEDMAAERRFDAVTLRAVEKMGEAAKEAGRRASADGVLVLLTSSESMLLPAGFRIESEIAIPGAERRVMLLGRHKP